jgi:hypothetical protein
VDWRWQKALRLHAEGRPLSRIYDDRLIAHALAFLQARERLGGDEYDELALFEHFPSIAEAHALYTATDRYGTAMRWELEARLLATNESIESIAGKIGCGVRDVECYEALFFNVRDRLDRTGYLLHHALGQRAHAMQSENDMELIWKLVAMSGGALALDDVMQVLTPWIVDDPALLREYYRVQNRDVVGRQSIIAAITLRVRDAMSKLQLMELNAKYVEVESKQDGSAGTINDIILDGLQKTLESMPVKVMEATGSVRPSNVLPNGVVLSERQMMEMAIDPNFKIPDAMLNAKFPEPHPRNSGEIEFDELESLGE